MKKLLLIFLACIKGLSALDIVIPVHKKDAESIDLIINELKKNIIDADQFYVISKEPFTDKAYWIDEKLFPFTIKDVADELGGEGGIGSHVRRGWYYQQLLKLYAAEVIENLSERFLIFDADTIPTHTMKFVEEDGSFYLDFLKSYCNLIPYFTHMEELLPELSKVDRNENPVVHHMLFSKFILKDLFSKVEITHNKPFWKVFCNLVKGSKRPSSKAFYAGASEYMIYYHFCFHFYPKLAKKREVKLMEKGKSLAYKYPQFYDFIAHHNYDRTE